MYGGQVLRVEELLDYLQWLAPMLFPLLPWLAPRWCFGDDRLQPPSSWNVPYPSRTLPHLPLKPATSSRA
ncbi:hypothetical protein FF1_027864 [Malus domestica]